jgi:DNA-binding CsgD family transcriptional regulator
MGMRVYYIVMSSGATLRQSLQPSLERINSAKTLEALLAGFRRSAGELGFDHCSMAIVPTNGNQQAPVLDSNFPKEFEDAYVEAGAHRFDPYWEVMSRSLLPILHKDMVPKYVADPRLRPVHEAGSDLNLVNGVVVPVPSVGVARGVGLWSTSTELEFDALMANHVGLVQLLAIHFMAAAESFRMAADPQGEPPRLSPRETDCLRLSALGLTSTEIGDSLGITERTVKFHIANSCRKLGAGRRTEAVSSALRLGLIDF